MSKVVETPFQNELLLASTQICIAGTRMLDNLIAGAVGKVELNLGSHILVMQTKKVRAVAKKKATRKTTKRTTGKVVRKAKK